MGTVMPCFKCRHILSLQCFLKVLIRSPGRRWDVITGQMLKKLGDGVWTCLIWLTVGTIVR